MHYDKEHFRDIAKKRSNITHENFFAHINKIFPSDIKYFCLRSSGLNGPYASKFGIKRSDILTEGTIIANSIDEGTLLVQEFIAGPNTKSGVLFIDTNKNITRIKAIPGLCDPVINRERCDIYYLNRESGEIAESFLRKDKRSKFFIDKFIEENVDPEGKGTLSIEEIKTIWEAGLKVKRMLPRDQVSIGNEVRWTFRDGQLYVLRTNSLKN